MAEFNGQLSREESEEEELIDEGGSRRLPTNEQSEVGGTTAKNKRMNLLKNVVVQVKNITNSIEDKKQSQPRLTKVEILKNNLEKAQKNVKRIEKEIEKEKRKNKKINSKDEFMFERIINFDDVEKADAFEYLKINQQRMLKFINEIDSITYPIKIKITISTEFLNIKVEETEIIKEYFSYKPKLVRAKNQLEEFFNNLKDDFVVWSERLEDKGSGFVFQSFINNTVKIFKVDSFKGSSYIPLEFKSHNIVNVQNEDNKCFLWSILAKKYPAKNHANRLSNYKKYEGTVNMTGINYPVRIEEIHKVEKQNEDLIINVFALNDLKDKFSIYPVYISNKKIIYKDNEEDNEERLLERLLRSEATIFERSEKSSVSEKERSNDIERKRN